MVYVKNHFFETIFVFAKEYYTKGWDYLLESVGSRLAWLNIHVNTGAIVTYIIILIFACISEESKFEFSKKAKLWICSIIFVISLMVFGTMYITFTMVGLDSILGIQGRYFTPILILLYLCLVKKNNHLKIENRLEKFMIISFIINIIALARVVAWYAFFIYN